jgi:hypothetical protein
LQAAASGVESARHLARAERDARQLRREDAPWARAFGLRLEAGLALARGDDTRARELFERALPALDDSGLALQAAVMRRHLGRLLGGEEGRRLVTQAESLMRERGVVNVEATARMYGVA